MALTATAGSATADSFISVADANTYMSNRLHTTEWDASTNDSKERALKMATVELNRMNWNGILVSTTSALRWPRSSVADLDGNDFSSLTIPEFLEQATTELANGQIIKDRYKEKDTTGIRKVTAGEVAVSFDRRDVNTRNPITVLQMINPFITGGASANYTLLLRA